MSTVSAAKDASGAHNVDASSVVAGLQVTAGGVGIAKGLIEDIPGVGQVFAGVAVGLDLVGTGLEVAKCFQ